MDGPDLLAATACRSSFRRSGSINESAGTGTDKLFAGNPHPCSPGCCTRRQWVMPLVYDIKNYSAGQ